MKFGNIVRVETLRHLRKITVLWRKASRSKVLAAKHTASLEFEISQRSLKGGTVSG